MSDIVPFFQLAKKRQEKKNVYKWKIEFLAWIFWFSTCNE